MAKLGLKDVTLSVMDASKLTFGDETFDAAAVMFVMTVVPNPAAVMAEMRRVLRPGGTAIVINHFSREHGLRAAAERGLGALFAQSRLASNLPDQHRHALPGIPAGRSHRCAAVRAFYASAAGKGGLRLPRHDGFP